LRQNYDPALFEVIVVDGQSTDETAMIVSEMTPLHPNLRLFENPGRLSSSARNIGVRHARGDAILIVDGHCDIDNDNYLRDVAEAFENSKADCLGRPQPLDVTGASSLQKAIASARSSWLGHHPASFIYSDRESYVRPQSVAVAYRRPVFEKVGLFDESFDACEDVEFNHRVDKAGLRCFFTPKIRVCYHPRASLPGLFRQMMRYGRGRVRLLRKHPETISLGSVIPALFVLGLLIGPLASALSSTLAIVFLAVVGFYLAVVMGVSVGITCRNRSARMLAWLPWVFLTIHIGTGLGVLTQLVVGRPRRTNPEPTAQAAEFVSTACGQG
jgi:succinoglycan biosynthesis protein ExoA